MSAQCRAAAARVLAATINAGKSLNASLPPELEQADPQNRALLQQLCYGTLRCYHRLQPIVAGRLKKPLRAKDADINALLLCGVYQVMEMRTPDHAAISSTVEASRNLNKSWATGLINGVLRRCAREKEQLLDGLSPAQLASHPDWLYNAIQAAWPLQLDQITRANNGQPPMYLRVNQRMTSRVEYQALLRAQDLEAQLSPLATQGLLLAAPTDVTLLPGFFEGSVSVQDEAAQLAAQLLNPAPGDRVLDACSAPGGKACHLLEQQPAIAELVAIDADATRLQRVRDNLSRLHLPATVQTADASQPIAGLEQHSFQRILVDAPCSGTGVVRRHPDIKLLRRAADIPDLAALQLKILNNLWPLLGVDGQLLYVTCSILPQENSEVIQAFLGTHADARYIRLPVSWGEDCQPGRQILPDQAGPDGLYFALLQKSA